MTIDVDKCSLSKSFVQPLDPVESTPLVESISGKFFFPNFSMIVDFIEGMWGGGEQAEASDEADDEVVLYEVVVDEAARFWLLISSLILRMIRLTSRFWGATLKASVRSCKAAWSLPASLLAFAFA